MPPLVLVTGFGPFLDAPRNPSGEVALALLQTPPEGVEIAATVLPVTFEGAPRELEAALGALAPRVPDLLLGLGLQRQGWLRLEACARAVFASHKPDVSGRRGAELGPLAGGELRTSVDLVRAAALLRAAGAPDVRLSEDAGGYVCERTYHAALSAGARLVRPALFLHVPPAEVLDPARQAQLLRDWLPALLEPRAPGAEARSAARA